MPAAPAYVATTFQTSKFSTGNGYPDLTPFGVYIADQPTMDALFLAAGKAGVSLITSANPFSGQTLGSSSQAPSVASSLRRQPAQRPRRLLHDWSVVNPDVTAFAAGAAQLAGATTAIAICTTGAAPAVIPANYALLDWGQGQTQAPQVYNSSGIGYVYHKEPWGWQSGKTIRFYTDSKYISVASYFGVAGFSKVWVDGQPAAASNTVAQGGATPSLLFLNLTFSTNKARLIEIKTDNWISNVAIESTAQIWAPDPLQGPRVLVVGESIIQGYYASFYFGAYQQLDEYTCLPNIAIDGQAGSGYFANGSYYSNGSDGSGSFLLPTRVANDIAWKPDVILVGSTLNDFNSTPQRTVAQVEADMKNLFSQYRAALPNATLIVNRNLLTPYFRTAQSSSIPALVTALDADLDGGLLDQYGVKLMPKASGYFTGTGYQGATNGSGNSDRYVYTDAAHMNDAGSQYLVRHVADGLLNILEAA